MSLELCCTAKRSCSAWHSKVAFENADRKCCALRCYALFHVALLCFAPCMDMHGFTLVYPEGCAQPPPPRFGPHPAKNVPQNSKNKHRIGPKSTPNHQKSILGVTRGLTGETLGPKGRRSEKKTLKRDFLPPRGPKFETFSRKNGRFFSETCVQHPFCKVNDRKRVDPGPRKCN